MDRPTKILLWNADGLRDRRHELLQFLAEYDVDVALLQETHLRPGDLFTAPGYSVYRTDRPGQAVRSGGTAALIHRRISHRHIPYPNRVTEATTVAIVFAGAELKLSSIYCPPGSHPLNAEMDEMLPQDQPALAGGDFNAKHEAWNSRQNSTTGRRLRAFLNTRPHINILVTDTPTHYPYNHQHRPDILDFALHCNIPAATSISTISDLSSDHLPVLISLEDPMIARLPPFKRPRVNWKLYYNHLADRPQPLPPAPETTHNLNEQVALLHSTLQGAMEAALLPAHEENGLKASLPPFLVAEIRKRRRLRREWQQSRSPRDKRAFNRQVQRVKTLLRDHSEGKWRDFLCSVTAEDGTLWRLARSLRREKPVIRPLHGRGGLVYTAEEKAEAFADSMEDQFSTHPDVYDEAHCDRIESFIDALDDSDEENDEDDQLTTITEDEVISALARLKPKKAPGPDSLGTPALRKLPPWIITWLTGIFNSCLKLQHFPSPWKSAKLILIPKSGKDPLFPDNHRPISLLPTLSKVLERLILSRFPDEFHQSIRPEQFGFRRGHSTTLQLTRVLTSLVDATNRKHQTTAVFIDIAKAFDKVWHDGLLYKLAHSPLPGKIVKILRSYLQDRHFAVSVGPAISSVRPVSAGVPQGSVLGPILYLWYTNDLPLAPSVTLSLYADDAMLQASSKRIDLSCHYIQRQLTILQPWLKMWRVKVNTTKCEAICFTRQHYGKVLRHDLTLNGDTIRWTKKVNYLGVTLDRLLSMSHHVKRRLDTTTAAKWQIGSLLCRRSTLTTSTKLMLYKSLLRPALLYAAPAWYGLTSKTWRKKLESFQSKTLRMVTSSPWFVRNSVIRESTGLPEVGTYIKETARRMWEAAEASDWEHIRHIASQPEPPARVLRRPRALLDDPP